MFPDLLSLEDASPGTDEKQLYDALFAQVERIQAEAFLRSRDF
jgi:hypothetical protein